MREVRRPYSFLIIAVHMLNPFVCLTLNSCPHQEECERDETEAATIAISVHLVHQG